MLRQVGQLDAIIVPISGGGMCSGVATVAKALRPGIRVIAAEPRGAALLFKTCSNMPVKLDYPKLVLLLFLMGNYASAVCAGSGHAGQSCERVKYIDNRSSPVRVGTAYERSQAPVKLQCK